MNMHEDIFHPVTEDCVGYSKPEGVKTPWYQVAEDLPVNLKYYNGSMVDTIEATAKGYPKGMA